MSGLWSRWTQTRAEAEAAELQQQLDVERRVAQLGRRERPHRPVGGPVPLLEDLAELAVDEGGQAHALASEQPSGQFGVEEGGRAEPDLGEAGEVDSDGGD